jgi:hypothetical protein
MKRSATDRRLAGPAIAIALGLTVFLVGCGKKETAAPAATAANPAPAAPAPAAVPAEAPPIVTPAAMTQPIAQTWSPEALEELLAPVALYPDPVLSQVLIASTNPQEVLDAGNWLLSNQSLTGKALDQAALKVGFTPPIRALIQFPETVDMMCMQLDWTTELGQAFVADQQGVLDAVQRLRKQAKDVGNLKSSDMMKVETQVQEGKEVVVLSPPKPEVVYVPQYDPQAVYAPAPAAPVAAAPATTTTTTTTQTGHSTGSLVATGLLAFGAGMLVNEIFDDDDNYHHNGYGYGYPNYGYGSMPYYPPYPYRPSYGNGYYPSNGYNRPPNYQHGFNNNNVVVINNPGGGNGGYWNDRNKRNTGYQKPGAYQPKSPITANKPGRTDLQDLNKRQPKPMPTNAKRPSPTATKDNWKSQGGYAGAKGGMDKASARPAAVGSAAPSVSGRDVPKKVQGSYAGATPDRAKDYNRPSTGPSTMPASRDMQRPQPAAKPAAGMGTKDYQAKKPQGDRGYGGQGQQKPSPAAKPQGMPQPMNKPSPAAKPQGMSQPMNRPSPSAGGGGGGNKPSAVSGANRGGNADRQASQRGKQSMPQGAKSKGGGGGGAGGKKKAR